MTKDLVPDVVTPPPAPVFAVGAPNASEEPLPPVE